MSESVIIAAATTALLASVAAAAARPDLVVRHARTVLALVSILTLAAAAALIDPRTPGFRMSLDPSEGPMIADGDPGRLVYAEAVADFGHDDTYVIAMQTEDVFTYPALATMRSISDEIRKLSGVRSVESLVETIAYRYLPDLDMVEVDSFVDEIPQGSTELEDVRRRALTDAIYPRTLVNDDSTTAGINVSFRSMSDGEFIRAGLDDSIAAILARAGPASFNVTGRQHIKSLTHAMMVRDLTRLIPLAVVVGATVARMATGSLRSAVVPVGSSLVATLWVFGAMAWLGRPLTLITLVLGPTLICVGSVYGVHILARFDDLLRESGQARPAALECLRYTRTPVLIAGGTTVAGFGALLLSDTPGIRELGSACALGIMAVTLLSLTAVPAVLALLAPRPACGNATVLGRIIERALASMADTATRRPATVLASWGVISVVAVTLIPRTVVDTDYLTFFDPDSRVRTDFEAISDTLVGAVPIYLTLEGGEEGAFREPANLRAVERLQGIADDVPGVSATLSMADLVRVMNRAIEKDDPAEERIPDTRGEVAELLFLIPKNKLRRFATTNHSRANIVVRTGLSGSAAILDLERRLHKAIVTAELPDQLTADVTGNTILVNHGADGIAANQFATVGAATASIFLIMWRAFRSVSTGALAMIPNVVPVLVFFGILGAGAAPLSLPTSLIGCIALGIAVDDTAHFLVSYRGRRRGGASPVEAAGDCVRTLGRPIVTTSLMLIAGFLVLSLSSFATLREFGTLSAVTMLTCLCADLLLLPALLVRARV